MRANSKYCYLKYKFILFSHLFGKDDKFLKQKSKLNLEHKIIFFDFFKILSG